jgi:prephenate dehydratase
LAEAAVVAEVAVVVAAVVAQAEDHLAQLTMVQSLPESTSQARKSLELLA